MVVPRSARILREAEAGLDERGDILVCLSPAEENSGVQIDIESTLNTVFIIWFTSDHCRFSLAV
jgi:hypothetical protein